MSVLEIAAPALPLHSAGKYVAAAYIVFVMLILVYVAIMAARLQRTERELAELRRDVSQARDQAARDAERAREPVA
jgi:type II secretory pathway component PulM